jgi:SAM-dependent methyltransferase
MKLRSLFRIIRPSNVLNSKVGWCPVCQRRTLFLPIDSIDTIRNHALCLWCRSVARNRHLALWMGREMHHLGINGPTDFRNHPEIKVFNASSMSATARALGRAPNIIFSEYFDGVEPGALKDGVMNQDLRRLTFQDNSLDLVLTEDVFEHVPEYREGFREVHRVLKQGGWHIFSIPYYFDVKTRDLFEMKEGKLILQEPIEYHGDPIRGDIPCFVHFGYDLLDFHRSLGFDIRIEWARYTDICKFGVFDCYTLIARKK